MKTDFYANATPFADMADSTTDEVELPYGFTMDDTGLWYQAELEDGKTSEEDTGLLASQHRIPRARYTGSLWLHSGVQRQRRQPRAMLCA